MKEFHYFLDVFLFTNLTINRKQYIYVAAVLVVYTHIKNLVNSFSYSIYILEVFYILHNKLK